MGGRFVETNFETVGFSFVTFERFTRAFFFFGMLKFENFELDSRNIRRTSNTQIKVIEIYELKSKKKVFYLYNVIRHILQNRMSY